jgi:hypothetical protein
MVKLNFIERRVMVFKKKEPKLLKYKDDWFISELRLDTNTYYSKDGFNFKRSRQDSTTMELISKMAWTSVQVLAIENANGDVISLGNVYDYISFRIENRILTLTVRTK